MDGQDPVSHKQKAKKLGQLMLALAAIASPILNAISKIWNWVNEEWSGVKESVKKAWHFLLVIAALIAVAAFSMGWYLHKPSPIPTSINGRELSAEPLVSYLLDQLQSLGDTQRS